MPGGVSADDCHAVEEYGVGGAVAFRSATDVNEFSGKSPHEAGWTDRRHCDGKSYVLSQLRAAVSLSCRRTRAVSHQPDQATHASPSGSARTSSIQKAQSTGASSVRSSLPTRPLAATSKRSSILRYVARLPSACARSNWLATRQSRGRYPLLFETHERGLRSRDRHICPEEVQLAGFRRADCQ